MSNVKSMSCLLMLQNKCIKDNINVYSSSWLFEYCTINCNIMPSTFFNKHNLIHNILNETISF